MTYYIDMDGVLADFFAVENAVKRCTYEKNFFVNLKPIQANVNALRTFIANGGDAYICSNSKDENTDAQKIVWLKKYIPEMKMEKVIFTRGINKKKYMVTETGTLLDDSEKNCHSWELKEGNVARIVTETIAEYLI